MLQARKNTYGIQIYWYGIKIFLELENLFYGFNFDNESHKYIN